MNKNQQVYVSTISDDPKLIFEHLPIYEEFGINGVHFDVMDGNFVPRLGLYPELLKSIRVSTKLPIEVHLMLSNPDKYIEIFVESGANRILVHLETLENPRSTLRLIKEFGVECCIVLNPDTSYIATEKFLSEIDSIMLMAIHPGVPKHPFIPATFSKLSELKVWLNSQKPGVRVGIDGGVTFDNVDELFNLGADWLICGSGTAFKPGATLVENLKNMQKILS